MQELSIVEEVQNRGIKVEIFFEMFKFFIFQSIQTGKLYR